jgi:hypothetical protein
MTMEERTVWAQLIVFPIVGIAYFAVVLSRVADQPAAEVSWVVPLLWAIGATIPGIILGTIAGAIGHGARATMRGEEPEFEDGDIRDKEIEKDAIYRTQGWVALGGVSVIVLAMTDADHFWIANAMFASGLLASVHACALRIRAYRRGF